MLFKRLCVYVFGGTVLAAATAMLTVVPADAADKWAAIFYSPTDEVVGWSNFGDSEHDAQSRAAFDCKGKGGSSCQIAASTANGCVALADTATHWAAGTGPDIPTAEHNAAVQLSGIARIVVSTCSG